LAFQPVCLEAQSQSSNANLLQFGQISIVIESVVKIIIGNDIHKTTPLMEAGIDSLAASELVS